MHAHKDDIIKGCACCVLATFLFGIMGMSGKLLTENHHPAEIVFYRYLIPLLPLLGIMIWKKRENINIFKTKKPVGLLLRCISGAGAMGMHVAALQYLPIADERVIAFTCSLFAPMIAYFILKEHVGFRRWTAILIGFGGVILIAGPTGNIHPMGLVFALIAALMDAGMITTLRYLKSENALTITFYLGIFGSLVTGIFFMPFVAAPFTSLTEIGLIVLVSICGIFAQLSMTYASRHAPTAIVSPFMYTSLVWAIMFDIVIWSKTPTMIVLLGGAIIISSNLFILYREHINAKLEAK